MGYKLCIAEKPSVANAIARIVGAREHHTGYHCGNGYIVTWAVGHLVGLAEPYEYGYVSKDNMYAEEFKERAYNETPMIPDKFKLIVLDKTKAQFNIVKSLMHRADVDEIIDCGDTGAEGHILQWFIREKAGCNKPLRRFYAVSMTDKAIKEAMSNLRNIKDFEPIIRGEFCKKKADWILGMSLSRVLSLKYNEHLPVGRVQTPTLAFVVKRYIDVMQFKVTTYYTMQAKVSTDKQFNLYWNVDNNNVFDKKVKDSENRVLDKRLVEEKCAEIKAGRTATIVRVNKTNKALNRPSLYDLITLQKEANQKYGYTAQFTLEVAQALYETQKVLSYPRTDSKFITSDLAELMCDRVRMIGSISEFNNTAQSLLANGLNLDNRVCDDSKVLDHHALIVTEAINGFDIESMTPSETEKSKGITAEALKNILRLVIVRMLVSFSQPFKYEETEIIARASNNMYFTAKGKKAISLGWKKVEQLYNGNKEDDIETETDTDEQLLPLLLVGQAVVIRDCIVVAKKTKSPKLYTEGTLLTAMENAGNKLHNGAILKGRGIGTQSTRGEVIKKLHTDGYIEDEKKGRTTYLKPTLKGMRLLQMLPPDLYSPQITADWENRIADIVSGKDNEINVMRDFELYVRQKTEQLKQLNCDVNFKERQTYGKCPFCGSPVHRRDRKEGKKIVARDYYCSDYKNCCWVLKTDNTTIAKRIGRNLTEAEAQRFIDKKFIVLTCKKLSDGSKYRAEFTFVVEEKQQNGVTKRYCNIKHILVKEKLAHKNK